MVLTPAKPRKMWGVTDQPSANLYVPMIAIIQEIIDETPDTKTFRLAFEDKEYAKSFEWEPGQFVEVTVFGAGEAPIGFASDPNEKSFFELTIVERGKVTKAMHALKKGDKVGIRGPFGNCWPLEDMKGKDILIVSGGCGLAPLRPAILQILANRGDYGKFLLLYGARTPADRNYKYDLDKWAKRDDMQVFETVDVADESWKGNVGVVTTLFDKVQVDGEKTVALTCGPPIMIKFVTLELLKMGFSEDRIVTSQERYMKCGVGKCGHCCVNHVYLCTEGPVFTYAQMKSLFEFKL
ncbi:MAG: FAD/NAD(P)-binding protein [Armatimonadota bacterium]|nr:FAD/NAD(P)-binding protein [Armatimonadota bacterium]